MGNRLDALIPNEYVGKEVEVIVFPLADESQPRYNAETMLMSEKSLAKGWDTPEEDEAWKTL
jgi:hypothetical protein